MREGRRKEDIEFVKIVYRAFQRVCSVPKAVSLNKGLSVALHQITRLNKQETIYIFLLEVEKIA